MPATAYKPPAAAELYPLPLSTHVGPLPAIDGDGGGALPHCNRDIRGNRREEEGVFLAIGDDPVADDLTGVIDAPGHIQNAEIAHGKIRHRVEIEHLAIGEKKCVRGTIAGEGKSHHLSSAVDALRAALVSAQRSQINSPMIGVKKCMINRSPLRIGSAGDYRGAVGIGRAAGSAQRPQILHAPAGVNERVAGAIPGEGKSHHISRGVDAAGGTGGSTERPEIGHGVAVLRIGMRECRKQ
jgi:hypothetical protein